MVVGEYNILTILRRTSVGLYLGDDDGNDVLLPNKYIEEGMNLDDEIEVFIYKDSEDRLVATTQTPLIFKNSFAFLHIKDVNNIGAFADWGLEKDLLIPYKEQAEEMVAGNSYVVYAFLDKETDRMLGSSILKPFFKTPNMEIYAGEEVEILPYHLSDLGMMVVVNDVYYGLIKPEDLTKELEIGTQILAYIKQVRRDGKLDISIEYPEIVEDVDEAELILEKLKNNKGFLKLGDKSSPEEIEKQLGMSKKLFKKTIGNLYRERKILIEEKGISLVK